MLNRPSDNYAIDYTAIVVRDAGGASAAPEGEMRRIYTYASATYTYTVDTAFTAAVASGDTIAIANNDIPMAEMMRIVNRALEKMGEVPNVNTSLTTVDGQYEYTLPIALKRHEDLLAVHYRNEDDDDWIPLTKWEIYAKVTGSAPTLRLPLLDADRVIQLTYRAVHPKVISSGTISEYIHPELIIAATTKMALRWMNGTTVGGTDYWLQRENEAANDLEIATLKYPIWEPKKEPKWFARSH